MDKNKTRKNRTLRKKINEYILKKSDIIQEKNSTLNPDHK